MQNERVWTTTAPVVAEYCWIDYWELHGPWSTRLPFKLSLHAIANLLNHERMRDDSDNEDNDMVAPKEVASASQVLCTYTHFQTPAVGWLASMVLEYCPSCTACGGGSTACLYMWTPFLCHQVGPRLSRAIFGGLRR